MTKSPQIIGVLNVTPDSFSDGGKFLEVEEAISHGKKLFQDGADIIDIGGEATGPGSSPVSNEEEIKRVADIITSLAREGVVSVDTYKAKTAEVALQNGAQIINDVSALRADPELAFVIKQFNSKVILMYSKEADNHPHASSSIKEYDDVVDTISFFLEERISYALQCGIPCEQIILDPGMGQFISIDGKYSWEVLKRFNELIERFSEHSFLVATSRKGFLGGTLEEREPLSQLTALHAYHKGASYIRTHNPKMMSEFLVADKQLQT